MHNGIPANGFAVVELFTSEGCSSCPPADEAVAEIKKDYPGEVYVLSFHVDYWNYLGWKDEFSEAAYSERQQQYGSAFNLSSIYTPQVVINGRKEFVGSDKNRLNEAVKNEIKITKNLPLIINAESSDNKTATVNYSVENNSTAVLNIALVQLNAESDIKRGENKGLKLKHVNIVRGFKTIALNKKSGSVDLGFPKGLDKNSCIIIAYLQDKNNFQISGAGQAVIK